MCWRVGNAFLLSATVDDIGDGCDGTEIGARGRLECSFPTEFHFGAFNFRAGIKGRT
jgi:hypothetical protein